jgi:hypothetical protein
MKITITIDDEQIAEACRREFLDSLNNRHGGHVAQLIRTAIAQQVTTDVVRPIVDDAIKRGVRGYAEEHLEEVIGRMVRKVVNEKKTEIARELDSAQMPLGGPK